MRHLLNKRLSRWTACFLFAYSILTPMKALATWEATVTQNGCQETYFGNIGNFSQSVSANAGTPADHATNVSRGVGSEGSGQAIVTVTGTLPHEIVWNFQVWSSINVTSPNTGVTGTETVNTPMQFTSFKPATQYSTGVIENSFDPTGLLSAHTGYTSKITANLSFNAAGGATVSPSCNQVSAQYTHDWTTGS